MSHKSDHLARDATVIAGVGTVVYCGVALLLHGILGFVPEAFGCFVGAWVSSYLIGTRGKRRFRDAFPAATGVVFATYVSIDLAHLAARLVRGTPTSWEPLILLLWAVGTTSWWLVPSVAGTIVILNRMDERAGRTSSVGQSP